MSELTEDELKQKVGIESWRNLSKEKFMTFVSALPDLDKEVALKIVGQFPDFKKLVLGAHTMLEQQAKQAVEANWESQQKVHQAFEQFRIILTKELDREGYRPEDRLRILELFKESLSAESKKDTEHKNFVTGLLKVSATIAAGGLVVGAGILGARNRN